MAKLILSDNTVFEGELFGANIHAEGEVVFNTGMVGYPQSLTDPSYQGQILVFTYPLIGNYGVPSNEKDNFGISKYFESDEIHVRGVVVSDYSANAFHWENKRTLHEWLFENNIPGIYGIDTRALTQKLREHGVMLGQIVGDNHEPFQNINDPNKENLVAEVSVKKPKIYKAKIQTGKMKEHKISAAETISKKTGNKTVVLIDCGMKNNILRSLLKRGLNVIRVPWNYNFFELKQKWDGIVISNGPGDPTMAQETCHLIKQVIHPHPQRSTVQIPIFGICLGVQILALAAGAKTYKLKFGHRAQNQPVIDVKTKRSYLTSQNHGFAVDAKSLPADWEVSMINANDNTVEGIKHKKLPFFAVQFHPEATPGPVDTDFLFDDFLKNL